MTASRVRMAAVSIGLLVCGPAAVVALRSHGALLAVPLAGMAALAVAVLLDDRRLARALRDEAAAVDAHRHALQVLATHDALTGAANRAAFVEAVTAAVASNAAAQVPVSVLLVDLDDFKALNSTLGHAAGDELLREAAARLRQAVQPADVARLDGDEFGVVLTGGDTVADVADAVHAALRAPFPLVGGHMVVRASIGIAHSEAGDVTTADELLRQADMALGAAKRRGKGRSQVFGPDLG